jgi:hypothetical protein
MARYAGTPAARDDALGQRLTAPHAQSITRAMNLPFHRSLFALPLLGFLAACGSEQPRPVSTPRPPHRAGSTATPPAAIYHAPPPAAKVQSLPGLQGVIGATQPELQRLFGTPRLDVVEGDARKLQFTGNACVLDVYLYPPAPGQPPRASYVDARRGTDARDVDRAACVAALRKR